MRKLLTWLIVTLGIAALVRKLRRSGEEVEPVPGFAPSPAPASAEPADQPEESDPAGELRAKLAETRTEGTTTEATPSSPPEPGSIEERRAEVHEQGRAALDEMQPSDEG
jgi:hypothetical protein